MTDLLILVLKFFGIMVIVTLGFQVSVGYTGLVNFGHAALVGVGSYAFAVAVRLHGWPYWLGVLLAVFLTAIASFFLALPTRKIRGEYFALISLGFLFVGGAVFTNWTQVTRGVLGIGGIPRPEGLDTGLEFLILVLVAAAASVIFLQAMARCPFGRALEAVRDDEEVAEALGKPVFKLKVVAMVVSGCFAGLGGALLASFVQFISPASFWLTLAVWILAGMMIGGMASMPGTVLGIGVLYVLDTVMRLYVDLPSDLIGPARLILFMAILILLIIFRPRGIMGRAQLED